MRYRWALRKYLKDYALTRESHASVKDFSRAEGEPDMRRAMEKKQTIQEHEIGVLRSKYLVRQAYLNDIQVPDDEASWLYSRYMGEEIPLPRCGRDFAGQDTPNAKTGMGLLGRAGNDGASDNRGHAWRVGLFQKVRFRCVRAGTRSSAKLSMLLVS